MSETDLQGAARDAIYKAIATKAAVDLAPDNIRALAEAWAWLVTPGQDH